MRHAINQFQTPSVVIHDLDPFRALFVPDEANAPLIIDANAVLALATALQRFKSIARRYAQIIQHRGPVKLFKFAQGGPLDVNPAANTLTEEECPRLFAVEGFDCHVEINAAR